MSRAGRTAAAALLSVLCFWYLAAKFDLVAAGAALVAVPLIAIVIACFALVVGAVLAGWRLQLVARDVGFDLGLRDAVRAMAAGQIVGALTVQFFGQILGRATLLRGRGIALPGNIAIAGYERLAALLVSLAFALAGAMWLFGHVTIDLVSGGAALVYLAVSLAVAIVASAAGWGSLAIKVARGQVTAKTGAAVARATCVTVAIQAFTALAYTALAIGLQPGLPIASLVAAVAIIMFSASLPISFGGWGVRELTAVATLSAIGVPEAQAIAVAVLLGLTSLASLGLIAAAVAVVPGCPSAPPSAGAGGSARDAGIVTALAWLLSVSVAVLISFQVHLPTTQGYLNANLADPAALLASLVLVVSLRRRRTMGVAPAIGAHLLACVGIIGVALAISATRYGWTEYAFINKGFGFIVLLCYAGGGMLVSIAAGAHGRFVLLRSFTAAVIAIATMQMAALLLVRLGWDLSATGFATALKGLSQNRNAYAFLLLCAIAVVPLATWRRDWLALGLLLAALWFTGSRAGMAAAVIVLALGLILKAWPVRTLAGALAAASGVVAGIAGIVGIAAFAAAKGGAWPEFSSGVSNIERWQSIVDGWRLFVGHPIFGAGLGAAMAEQGPAGVIIHSTPVWLLAETGSVGFVAFLSLFGRVVYDELRAPRPPLSAGILLVLAGFSVMAAAHELTYQRPLWFLLGALLCRVSPPVRA